MYLLLLFHTIISTLSYPYNFFSLKTIDQEMENVLIEKYTKWKGVRGIIPPHYSRIPH